jgi:membrane-bound lytic murein transglycosylase D
MNEATHCERVMQRRSTWHMYKMFGDWDLVLASYNSGPGNVTKAQTFGWAAKLEHQKNLPRETQGYVPAFLATMYIYEYHRNTELSQIEP